MRWTTVLQAVLVLLAGTSAYEFRPDICDEEGCFCGTYETLVCSCLERDGNITLKPSGDFKVPGTLTRIVINACERVTFKTDSVKKLSNLHVIEIRNVNNLIIEERGMAWAPNSVYSDLDRGVRITINGTTIREVSSNGIQGRINELVISNSNIDDLKPFAISSLTEVSKIELRNNIYGNIHPQAFKKFTTPVFLIQGGFAEKLPSRFLSEIEVTNLFRVGGMNIKQVSSLTFIVSSPMRVLIDSNNIGFVDGEAFKITTRGPVMFRNNTVTSLYEGAFYGISVETQKLSSMGKQEFLIDNNTVTVLTPSSLMFNRASFEMRVDGLNLNVTCSCELAKEWREVLDEGGIITCWYALEEHYISLPTFVNSRCGSFKHKFWIFVVIAMIAVIIGSAITIYCIIKRDNEKKKNLDVVLPDSRTYKETEFHVVVERAELLTTDF